MGSDTIPPDNEGLRRDYKRSFRSGACDMELLQSVIDVVENFISELASANFLLQQRLELMTYSTIRRRSRFIS